MNLSDFMAREGLDQSGLASKLNVHQTTVCRILERGTASPKVALALEAFTEGAIPADTLSAEVAAIRQSGAAA